MASYGNTVLTSAGIDLVKRVIANTATFEITRVATSSDSGLTNATISTIEALTTLPSMQQTGKVTAFDTSNSKQVGLKCEFTNEGLTNQYDICAVGIYAKEAGKSEVLFAVAPAKEPETMPAKPTDQSALFTFSLNMYVVVGQASAMTITATTEGVVKSINGTIKPDTNGNVVIDDSSHAKFIEAELINGHLLVPLVDDSGNPITDPAGNQLIADEYLPKSVTLGNHPAIYPGIDNTVSLPVYTQAEIDAMLSAKADMTNVTTKEDVNAQTGLIYGMLAQNLLVAPLAGDNGMTLLDEAGNALVDDTKAVTSINGKTPGADGNINIDDYYSKQAIDNRLEVKADLLQMEDEHNALQSQITDNTDHLVSVDDTLDRHAKQISQATGEASYALDQISTGQTLTALSDGQGGYLTDENGNTLLTPSAWVNAIKLGGRTYTPDSAGSVTLDTYSMQEISNLIDSLKLAAKAYTDTAKSDLTTAMNNADNSVLSQSKAYTDTAKSDLTAAMNTADASALSKANAYTDFSLRGVWTPTVITTAIDLNNLKACGNYFIQGYITNNPIPKSWLYLRVEGVPTRITQTAWKDIDPANQWVRVYTDTNSWGNWVQITKAI